jgi:hypothetical protein
MLVTVSTGVRVMMAKDGFEYRRYRVPPAQDESAKSIDLDRHLFSVYRNFMTVGHFPNNSSAVLCRKLDLSLKFTMNPLRNDN